MEFALEKAIGTGVCETCAERGRPNEPVYKMGMCEFCYKGLPHPHATREQLARERAGMAGTKCEQANPLPDDNRLCRSKRAAESADGHQGCA